MIPMQLTPVTVFGRPYLWDGRRFIGGPCPVCHDRYGGTMILIGSPDSEDQDHVREECDTCEQSHELANEPPRYLA